MFKIYNYYNRKLLAVISGRNQFSNWCAKHGYLPYRPISGGYIVISTRLDWS